MEIILRILRNLLGLVLKLTILPGLLLLFADFLPAQVTGLMSDIFGTLFILIGLYGMMISDLLILRFGDGNVHYAKKSTRLVDLGLYARTRHPFFWFFSIYQYGILLIFFGFNWLMLCFSICIAMLHILWLHKVQEPQLSQSLGESYRQYKGNTPFLRWKMKVADNLKVGFRAQFVWLLGMLVIRPWYRIKIQGSENIPRDRPFLIVSNHECYLDPFLFAIFLPYEIKFVTTADVFTTRMMRFLLKGTGSFPMRRHKQDLKSIRTMIRMINKGQVVCIFPEGGRSVDGSPLPILNETLKLIQHCRVPILPVHLDGAYEVWPRWAPNRRRGKVTTSFKPMIPVEDQKDLGELESLIKAAIFSENKIFRSVRSRTITKGMNHLLWACYKCRTRNSIEVTSGKTVRCKSCQAEWQVSNDYAFTASDDSQSLTSIEWIKQIKADLLNYPLSVELPFALDIDEEVHLFTSIHRYDNEEEVLEGNDMSLILSNQRIILSNRHALMQSWSLANITIFTMDYFNAVSIGVGGVRHAFKLPPHEITLKWQTYFDTLKAKF